MKTQNYRIASSFFALVASCLITLVGTNPAFAGPGWDYKVSHGLAQCEFEVDQSGLASVNGSVVNTGPKAVTITAEVGKAIDVKLYCNRSQSFDKDGQLADLGREVSYSGPGGSGLVVGVDKPEDSVSNGYRRPKGRQWTLMVGNTPSSYTLRGGSDTLAVTVSPVIAPVSEAEFQPVRAEAYTAYGRADAAYGRANEAYDAADHSYQNRVFQITGAYLVHLDSIGRSQDARGQRPSASQGFGLDVNVFLGGKSQVKFLTGLTADYMSRQKAVAFAPNLPDNGFNGWVDWGTYFVGPKAGVDYMPTSWFQLQAWGSLGALVSVDGTIPISQLPDRTLYSGESGTKGALGYKALIQPQFLIGQHFVLGLGIGLEGNASQLPVERGPERICPTGEDCLVVRQGHFVNALVALTIGGQL